MADVVISEFITPGAIADLAADFDVAYDEGLHERPAELARVVAPARALIVRNRTQVTRELVAGAPSLAVVGRLGVGLDNIDLDACRERGVAVRPATGANAVAVAEYVIAAALLLTRRAFGATARVAAGEWPRGELMGNEVAGRRLGLVGFGGIAREVAARARGLGIEVAAFDPYLGGDVPDWVTVSPSLGELLPIAEMLSVHVPLTDETRGLLGAAELAALPPGAVVINTARGGIVDEQALVAALRAGRLGGAALDVFATEPLDAAAGAPFAGVPNLLLTPHIAGVTEESYERVSDVVVAAVREELGA